MKLKELIAKLYGVKKDNTLKHFGLNFVKKNGLDLEKEYTTKESVLAEVIILLTDSEKRKKALSIINEIMVDVVESGVKLSDLRTKNYKQIARMAHPDSDTGDTESFQVLQEIKEYLWDYKGEPRDKIEKFSWSLEKEYCSHDYNKYDKYRKK